MCVPRRYAWSLGPSATLRELSRGAAVSAWHTQKMAVGQEPVPQMACPGGNMGHSLRSPGGFILTRTQMAGIGPEQLPSLVVLVTVKDSEPTSTHATADARKPRPAPLREPCEPTQSLASSPHPSSRSAEQGPSHQPASAQAWQLMSRTPCLDR